MKSSEINPSVSHSKIVSSLQGMLKQQISKREQAQQSLVEYRSRSLRMENQYIRLLEKYSNDLAVANGRESYSQDIWAKLVDQIERFNQREENILEHKCAQIEHLMERRLNSIIQKTEEELNFNKKLAGEEFQIVKEDIKSALNIAKEIEDENQTLRAKVSQLQFKNRILTEERRLLLQQICTKKRMIEKMIEKQRKELAKINSPASKIRAVSPLSVKSKMKNKSSSSHNETIIRFMGEPDEWFQRFGNTTSSSLKRGGSTRVPCSPAKKIEEHQEKTADHMRICLERQRRKRMEYGAIVGKMQNMKNQISDLIEKGCCDPEKLIQEIQVKIGKGNKASLKGLNEQDLRSMGI